MSARRTLRRRPRTVARGRSAFTLVELLVVIGIIALLIAILLPALQRAREQANRITCTSNLRQVAMAFMMYLNESKGQFPRAAPRDPVPQHPDDWLHWEESGPRKRNLDESPIAPYLGRPVSKAVLRCPSDNAEEHTSPWDPPYKFSYVMNSLINSAFHHPYSPGAAKPTKITEFRNPTEKIILVEEDERSINDAHWAPVVDWLAIRHDRTRRLPDTNQPENLSRRGNVAFADGHADYIPREMSDAQRHYDPTFR